MRIEESLNVTFDESLPEPKSFPFVEDERISEPIIQNPVRSSLLEANALEPGYPKSLKEARGDLMEQITDAYMFVSCVVLCLLVASCSQEHLEEMLTLLLQRKIRNNDDFKYHHGCKELKLVNLCFADDLMIFCHGDVTSAGVVNDADNIK
ncbi:hypothetical protein Tco_0721905 [Tanacetum coccineum]